MKARRVRRPRKSERGFTLIELLVASIAGLFVVLAAFMLSRGATRLFASEGRVGNSQLNLRLGVDRLRQDLDRAGFMTTPNVKADPDVCPDPASLGVPVRLQSLFYQPGTSATSKTETPLSADNNLNPDRLTISGNFATTDSYLAAVIQTSSSGSGHDIVLQPLFSSTARLLSAGETGSPLANVQSVFAQGRMLRIRNLLGSSQFVVIQSASIGSDGRPIISTAAAPAYTLISGSSTVKRCGGSGNCLGCEINPVQIVRYEVRSLASDPRFAWAYAGDAGSGVGEKDKYDLVRSELRADGSTITDSEEIVAEYAVDLAFAFGVDRSPPIAPGSPYQEPELLSLPFTHPDNGVFGGDVLASTASRPQRIRSVRYRLTTRTRFADYNAATDDAGPGLSRYMLGPERYSRARTVMGEIALTNQQGIRW